MEKKNGFVAMLDVLGFSEQVAMDAEVNGLDDYVDNVVRVSTQFDDLRSVLFSDTVVLYSLGDTLNHFKSMLSACSILLYSLLMKDIPIRGAIAYGSFRRSEDTAHGVVIAGQPIIEAHYYESQQQWIGIMATRSLLRRMQDLIDMEDMGESIARPKPDERSLDYLMRMSIPARLQSWRIPLKGELVTPFEGFAVVPTSLGWNELAHTKLDLKDCIQKLDWLKMLAPDARSQAKHQNSIAFFKEVYNRWLRAIPD